MSENIQNDSDNNKPIKLTTGRRGFLIQITSAGIGVALSPFLPLALNNNLEKETDTYYPEA